VSEQQTIPDNPGVITWPPLIAIATLLLGLAADWLFPLHIFGGFVTWPIRAVIGVLVFVVGGVLALAAERTFKRIGTNVAPWEPSLRLATTGVYGYLRNPMYVGLGLMTAGAGIAFASGWTFVLMIPAALILHYGIVLREERYLERKFGDAYRAYKARVPRYGWPR
jgi:protein-S-isoprenylcysteine O-methyltransferase Ste14